MLPTKVRSLLNSESRDDSILFRYFVRKGWSTWSILFCLAILIGTPLSGVKVLPVSPSHIQPALKISLLDWIEAQRLSSSAQHIEEGKTKGDLLHTWKMAINANPGNTEYQKNYLEALVREDRHRESWQDAIDTTESFLLLAQTNISALELACQVYEHYQLDEPLLEILESHQGTRSPRIESHHLLALFSMDRVLDFQTLLDQSSPAIRQDPIFNLHQTALLDTCDTKDSSDQAYKKLDEALANEKITETALRLQLYVSHKNGNLEDFERSFTLLTHRFEDKTGDHLRYWDLLKRSSKIDEARKAAKAFARIPRSAKEVISVADGFTNLGLRQLAFQYLDHYIDEFGTGEKGRHAQSKIFIAEKDWPKLERLALTIRANDSVSSAFLAYSYFLEGIALYHSGRPEEAGKAFEQISKHSMRESDLALYVGSQLGEYGFPGIANDILAPEREKYRNNTTYWDLILENNRPLQNTSQMLIAAENLKRLVPNDLTYNSAYATLILTQPLRRQEALELTTELLSLFPANTMIQLNHAIALIQNERHTDAISILTNLKSVRSLNESNQSRLNLAWMEIHFAQNDFKRSWQRAQQIEPGTLLPEYRTHFLSIRKALESEDPTQFQPDLSLLTQ